uniref:50S ribosomal protein L27, chloroplastic n=1 Tax=Dunaliella tertiolecta TaxID=3047 RepID=A0A7S3R6Z4_DUNTE|mmetsp:Transcript_19631/g.54736  ORF Transcript_19631/g.54736 Transcript_19631/m.54736 type:complete len:167 (+) Transcript_19631:1095-1595(+)
MQASLLRSQTMAGVVAPAASRRMLVVQNAHKKGAGSTKNGRDSNSKSRGVKVFGGQPVKAGGIIVRQTGSTWHSGVNTDLGKDYTVYALEDGIVMFDKKKERPGVHVYPLDHEKAKAMIAATHTKQPKEGTKSRRERRLEQWKGVPRKSAEKSTISVATVNASTKP